MAEHSLIEWTDATWNPITGCSVISPGCTNCYAMRLAGTRLQHHPSRAGLTTQSKAGPVWNGQVRLNEEWLDLPLRWKRPRRIFVCAHGDLFHENVPDAWIDRVFAVMAKSLWHTFQVLTKRPERMREYLTDPQTWTRIVAEIDTAIPPWDVAVKAAALPLPNVWLGTSVEDRRRADERIFHLLETPAAVRFLSVEPMLGLIDLRELYRDETLIDALDGISENPVLDFGNRMVAVNPKYKNHAKVDWVICGGESGPGARDMHPDWARSLRNQCKMAGVPFFMKQMARKAPIPADLLVREFPR